MATAYLYTINKRRNSTALPTSSGRAVSLVLKDGTSLTDPTFILSGSEIPDENYIEFEGRYYHVLEITSIRGGVWGLNCHVDVLATYRNDIMSTTAFVSYDTAANTEISDKRLSIKTTIVKSENVGSAFDYLGKGFCVALNVVGSDSCCCYILPVSSAATLLNQASVWNADYFPEVDDPEEPGASIFADIVEAVQKLDRIITYACRQFISSSNAASCITSACIIPLPYGAFTEGESDIYLGIFNTTVKGKKRVTRGFQDASTVSIPWQATDWRRNSPYHEIYLYIPFIGVVNFPASSLIGDSNLYVDVAIDETAGDALFTVSTAPLNAGAASKVIGQYSTNLSSNFPIGAANVTAKSLATTLIAGAAGAAAAVVAPAIGSAAAAGSGAIIGELNGISAIPSSVGGAGGGAVLALFGYNPRCMTIFHDTVVSPDSVSAFMGTPAMAVKSLTGLSGYVETRLFSVSGDMLENERIEINRFMDGGVYIE